MNKSLLVRLLDITQLPTRTEVATVFPFLDPNTPPLPDLTDDKVLRPFSRESLITPDSWIYFYSNKAHFRCEILTQEYIDSLAAYIEQRARVISSRKMGEEVVILEVGAGNGALSYHLGRTLMDRGGGDFDVRIVASDKGIDSVGILNLLHVLNRSALIGLVGNVGDLTGSFTVEKLTHKEALKLYHPDIVVASWMSRGVDWTADFRVRKCGLDVRAV